MAGTYLGLPFDEELFLNRWNAEPDPVKTALIESGVIVENAEIAKQIAGGSNIYSVPFYKNLPDTAPVNYDGDTDITSEEITGANEDGVVYGRAKAWMERDFVRDFHRADPMGFIASQVAGYWAHQDQKILLGIMKACMATTAVRETGWADALAAHTTDISTASTVGAGNLVTETTLAEAAQKACGDNSGIFTMAFMHSKIANALAKKDLLEYRKYTDPMGIQRQLNIADINGYTVIVDDSLVEGSKYLTFLAGAGMFHAANAPVQVPVEVARDPKTKGGENLLYTRVRKTIKPNGFSFVKPSGMGASPADNVLTAAGNYKCMFNPKSIALAKIVSNG